MIYKLYQKQVEAWEEEDWEKELREYIDKMFKPVKKDMAGLDRELVIDFVRKLLLSSRHKDTIELLEAEIERKRGMRKEMNHHTCGVNKPNGCCVECSHLATYNSAIDEDIAYLEEQLELIKKEL